NVIAVHCTYDSATRSGTPGADARKVKGNIHWLSIAHAVPAEVRLYDRLFAVPYPGARTPSGEHSETIEPAHAFVVAGDDDPMAEVAERDFLDDLNPASKRVITAQVEPALVGALPEDRVQFERHGYFVADIIDHNARHPVFNRTVTLRDSWTKSTTTT
ncbi:MAG TPA: hypothetical protein VEO36_10795, partial [Casimicrobiaceae bacterium]|nr:hypothetical protein [Casimicrobiaceae bacterium]